MLTDALKHTGYDQEEAYFHESNVRLIEEMRQKKKGAEPKAKPKQEPPAPDKKAG